MARKKSKEAKEGAEPAAEALQDVELLDEEQVTSEEEPAEGSEETSSDEASELEVARAEAAEATDRALRTLAEFDNYRKRSERERQESHTRGASSVLLELLDVADNFDRALESVSDDVPESFLEGMKLVARGIHDLLDRHQVSKIEAVGEAFDPELHDALTRAPSADQAPNTVLQEVQPGYRMADRVLRPAKVVVAAPLPAEQGDDS